MPKIPTAHQLDQSVAQRDGFGAALVELGRRHPEVVVLTADLAESTRASWFAEAYPDRFFQCGVAEQNLMGVAAGMAATGLVPFVCSFAVFSPGRNWDQLRVSVCYSQLNVKVIGSHIGFSDGGDGGTHQALEDIAITRCLPNLTVLSPADARQAYDATLAAATQPGPVYLRLSRSAPYHPLLKLHQVTRAPFLIGQAQVIDQGKDVTIAATGLMVNEALAAAEQLKKDGIDAEVLNVHTIKPLDRSTLIASLKKTGCLVTIEEHQRAGGLGSAILEEVAGTGAYPIEVLGVADQFGQTGQPAELAAHYGLTAAKVVQAAQRVIAAKVRKQWVFC